MASNYSPLVREQRNQFLMNGLLIAAALVGGTAVTNERGLFVPVGIHNAISATAQAFAAIATPEGLRRLMTNSSPFAIPVGQTATPLGRLTISSGIPLPTPEEETMAWMPQEGTPGDTAERLASADFPTVTNGEVLAANTPVGPDGAPVGGASGADAGGGAAQPTFASSSDAPGAQPPFTQIFAGPLPLPVLIAANPTSDLAICTRRNPDNGAIEADPACIVAAGGGSTPSTGSPTGGTPGAGGGTTGGQTPPAVPPTPAELPPVQGAVPEPAAWAMLIGGFGLLGLAQRLASARRRRAIEDAEIQALREYERRAA